MKLDLKKLKLRKVNEQLQSLDRKINDRNFTIINPEGNHAVKGAIDAALECKKNGESKTILFNLCGHGHFDMKAYGDYFEGSLAEDKFDKGSMDKALEDLPKIA